ncbi:MAG: 50S ribosomal protein L9 [Bacteroidota bacterium]|jgi:large subunit ribosomal protein L9
MKLILREDVNKLGTTGEVVDVKPGYGRNYLIPQGKAILATDSRLAQLEAAREEAEKRAELTIKDARELADRLETISVTIPVKTGEDDKIFGTVTNQDIADALAERDIEIDRRKISLDQEVKALGEYTATISLISELKPTIKVWVVKDE